LHEKCRNSHFFVSSDGFTLYAADLVHNSTVSPQIVYLCSSRQAKQLVFCVVEFVFNMAK